MSNVTNPHSVLLEDSSTGKPVAQKSTGYAALVTNPNGVVNGGWKVSEVNHPARNVFIDFFFGADDTLSAALTAGSANNGLWVDQSLLLPDTRQIVIVNGSNGGAVNYAYDIRFSRNGGGVTTDDAYTVITSGAAARAQIVAVPVPVATGYDAQMQLVITPTAGQAGTQLQFKAYLIGRGG